MGLGEGETGRRVKIIPGYLLEQLIMRVCHLQTGDGREHHDGTGWERVGNKELHADLLTLSFHGDVPVESKGGS